MNAAHASPLAGKMFDAASEPVVPSHANKAGRRYRYYISKHLITGEDVNNDSWRLPAHEIEKAVEQCVERVVNLGELRIEDSPDTRVIFDRIERVEVHDDMIGIKLLGSNE